MANVYNKGQNVELSVNFNSNEFDCKCKECTQTKIDPLLVAFLQKIRTYFNAPVTINSGYRCENHNANVGGAKNSRHTKGQAADISVKGAEPKQVAKYAESIGVLGIGLYDSFVHIDTRITKSFWYGQSEEYRATFGGENLIKQWQKAAVADGFILKSGADGIWGNECESVAKKAVLRLRVTYKHRSLTKFVQTLLGVSADGKYGKNTKAAVKQFQAANGLSPDGEVGVLTYKKLLGVA